MKNKITGVILATIALASSAHAALITGNVQLSASSSVISIDFASNTVTFTPAAPTVNAKVDTASGLLGTLLPSGTDIIYKSFSYDPLVIANPIWATTSNSVFFNLTSITSYSEFPGAALIVFGTGTINATGYESTAGTWSFNSSSTGGGVFSWGSTATVTRVPDGGASIALLGMSLLGVAGVKRKLRK